MCYNDIPRFQGIKSSCLNCFAFVNLPLATSITKSNKSSPLPFIEAGFITGSNYAIDGGFVTLNGK